MKRSELLKYEGESVMLEYKNRIGPQIRAGHIKAIAMETVIFWPLSTEKDIEIQIPFVDINSVEELI